MLLYQDNNKRVAIKSIFIRTTEEREKKNWDVARLIERRKTCSSDATSHLRLGTCLIKYLKYISLIIR